MRAQLTKAQAEKVERENDIARGKLITVAEFRLMVTSAFARVRSKLLELPSKLAPLVVAAKTAAEAQGILRGVIDDALNELAATRAADCFDADGDPGDSPMAE